MFIQSHPQPTSAQTNASQWLGKVSSLTLIDRDIFKRDGVKVTKLTLEGEYSTSNRTLSVPEHHDLVGAIIFTEANPSLPSLRTADDIARVQVACTGDLSTYARDVYYQASILRPHAKLLPSRLFRTNNGEFTCDPSAMTVFDVNALGTNDGCAGLARDGSSLHVFEGKARQELTDTLEPGATELFDVQIRWTQPLVACWPKLSPTPRPCLPPSGDPFGKSILTADSSRILSRASTKSKKTPADRWHEVLRKLRYSGMAVSQKDGRTYKDFYHTGEVDPLWGARLAPAQSAHLAESLMFLHANLPLHLPNLKEADREFEAKYRTRSNPRAGTEDYWAKNMAHAAGQLMSLDPNLVPRDFLVVEGALHVGPRPSTVHDVRSLTSKEQYRLYHLHNEPLIVSSTLPPSDVIRTVSAGHETCSGIVVRDDGWAEGYRIHFSWERRVCPENRWFDNFSQ